MKISKQRIREIIKEENDKFRRAEEEINRTRAKLESISQIASQISNALDEQEIYDPDIEEWVQEDIAVVNAMLSAILQYEKFEKVRS
jgi:methyl-accepting chemotaxis protein|tara:strand:- start:12245 stop:12505 length:261 start_codon:yes stop_codon:yes gene_type:complete